MTTVPRISVVIPVYNGLAYVEETFRAVLRQTVTDWELILVDNRSTDGTSELLRRLVEAQNDPRVRIVTNPVTLPAPVNWNVGLREARGEYLKLICADDIPTADCLERQARVLADQPTVSVAAGARIIINSRGRVMFTRSGIRRTGIHPGRDMIRQCIMSGTNIIGDPVNVMWRRSAMEKIGFFDPTVVYCTDVEYWLRLLSVGDLFYDTQPVGYYRIHAKAAATGLSGVTVRDFLHTARLQETRGSVSLSPFNLRIIAMKSRFKSMLRQLIYRLLG
jgi:glycosyltransferase involved in cell wall biosynthesis